MFTLMIDIQMGSYESHINCLLAYVYVYACFNLKTNVLFIHFNKKMKLILAQHVDN